MSLSRLLSDPTELNTIQNMLDDFCELTGLAAVVADELGQRVTALVNVSDYCKEMRKKDNLCCLSDRKGAKVAVNIGETCIYVCHAGLIDFAIPLFVSGKHVGSILAGQVRYEDKPTYDFSSEAIREWLSEESMYNKYQLLPSMNEDQIKKSARVLDIIRNYIVQRIEVMRVNDVNEKASNQEVFLQTYTDYMSELLQLMCSVKYLQSVKVLDQLCDYIRLNKPSDVDIKDLEVDYQITLETLLETGRSMDVLAYDDYVLTRQDAITETYFKVFDWTFNEILERKPFRVKDELDYAIAFTQRFHYKKISVRDVASYSNLSPDYFSRLFKRRLGVSYSEYLTQRRLTVAKLLLERTEDPINAIAITLGFGEAGYFTRVFKKYMGCAPSDYRIDC